MRQHQPVKTKVFFGDFKSLIFWQPRCSIIERKSLGPVICSPIFFLSRMRLHCMSSKTRLHWIFMIISGIRFCFILSGTRFCCIWSGSLLLIIPFRKYMTSSCPSHTPGPPVNFELLTDSCPKDMDALRHIFVLHYLLISSCPKSKHWIQCEPITQVITCWVYLQNTNSYQNFLNDYNLAQCTKLG